VARRGLVDPKTHKTLDWNGDDKAYAKVAVELYEAQAAAREAEAPTRFTARLIRRLTPAAHKLH
jgi:hypothetical protein